MKSTLKSHLARLASVIILSQGVAACVSVSTNEMSTAVAPPPAAEAVEPWDGDGMDIPLDGSSLEAFEKSLARVEAHTSPSTYTTLVNAIDYLLLYDLSAKRDKAKLAANLDGATGREVIDKVRWTKY